MLLDVISVDMVYFRCIVVVSHVLLIASLATLYLFIEQSN